ncbi:MAG TPA: ATP-binding protein [Xanthobacteraceae bacterium]|jgi:ATP-dependent DNA helicase RecG|nr:ATP-binding protein [Xanthobacteraceae bacterium]
MAVSLVNITAEEASKLLSRREGHFFDFKRIAVTPAKLTRTLSGFANSDGGELLLGVAEDKSTNIMVWDGFAREEDANAHIQVFESFFPSSAYFRYQFLKGAGLVGIVLHCEIFKTPDLRPASDGINYIRRGAQNLPQTTNEQITRLKYDKGLSSYEDVLLNVDISEIANSTQIIKFMIEVVPLAEPEKWLAKQQLIVNDKPSVAGAILFSDEPQVYLPKSGIKLYRYRTSGDATRETLDSDPITLEGSAYDMIFEAVRRTAELAESIKIMGVAGLESIVYPREAIHEIVTNAVLHRDYSINDDIHVRVFDNRVEVKSPGGLPGHVTVANVLDERFARNPKMVRIINKFPNAPNKDVGEGLNTAFEAMRE